MNEISVRQIIIEETVLAVSLFFFCVHKDTSVSWSSVIITLNKQYGISERSYMKKYKLDRYVVYNKKRKYEIIVFPKEPFMWAYEDSPYESGLYMVDGDKNAFKALSLAMALLANDFGKIIYFPLDGKGLGSYYTDGYKLVLCRPELQFGQSEWYDMKSRLDQKHYEGKYVLSYDKQKLNDFFEATQQDWKQKKCGQAIVRKVLGDTLFLTLPRYCC